MKVRSVVPEHPSSVVRNSFSDAGPALGHPHLTPAYPPAGFCANSVCPQHPRRLVVLLVLLVAGLLVGCSGLETGAPRTPTPRPLAE